MPTNFDRPRGLSRALRLTPAVIVREVRLARASGERITITDTACRGLRLIIGPRSASWSVTARPRGCTADGRRCALKSVVIGDVREVDPKAAREAAAVIKRQIALGADPVSERRDHRRQEAAAVQAGANKMQANTAMLERILAPVAITSPAFGARLDFSVLADAALQDCAAAFLTHGAGGARHHIYQTGSNLGRALAEMDAPTLRPGELDRQRVRGLVEAHARAGRPAVARQRLSAIARLYRWLRSVEVAVDNPAVDLSPPPPPPPRTHVWAARDVQALWQAADRLPPARAAFVKLALLLPLRRAELAGLTFANIARDHTEMEIRLAATETKNRKAFTLPLTGMATSIVEELLARGGAADTVLIPLARDGGRWASWALLTEQVSREAGFPVRWHSTRRTFASECGEHGLGSFAIVDGLLNHARSASVTGVARHYHFAAETAARRTVMASWDEIILHAAEHGLWPRQELASETIIPWRKGRHYDQRG